MVLKKFFLALFIVFVAVSASSQNETEPFIEVFGQLSSEQLSLKNAKIEIKQDGQSWQEVKFKKHNGDFKLALPLGSMFIFRFTQTGTIQKMISFSTFCPDEYRQVEYAPFFFIVNLNNYTQYPEIDTLFYSEPVGKIFFNEEFITFDYDREYNLLVQQKKQAASELLALRTAQKEVVELAQEMQNPVVVAELDLQDRLEIEDVSINRSEDTVFTTRARVRPDSLEIAKVELNATELAEPRSDDNGSATIETLERDSAKVLVADMEKIDKAMDADQTQKEQEIASVEKKKEDISEVLAEPVSQSRTEAKYKPQPVNVGRADGKEYSFLSEGEKQITTVFVTRSGKTMIYKMVQYNSGKTLYYKQSPTSSKLVSMSKASFTRALR